MSTEELNPASAAEPPADPQALLACLEAQLGEQKDLAAARLLIAAVIKAFQERADE